MIDHIRLGDTIPGLYPSYYTLKDIQEERRLANPRLRRHGDRSPVRAVVEYIHPKGRFVTVRYHYDGGSFCEAVLTRGGANHG